MLVTEVLHSVGWPAGIGSLTVLWVHVATALVLVPLAIWHVLARKTRLSAGKTLTRRNLIRTGGLVSVAVVAVRRRPRHRAGTTPRGRPAVHRIARAVLARSGRAPGDVVARRPDPRARWRLLEGGDRGRRRWTLASLGDLAVLPIDDVTAVLDCTSGWYSNQEWHGVRLDRLVEPGTAPGVVAWSATGYARRFPVSDLDSMWLVTEVGGDPLSPGHGFQSASWHPTGGFWWVKWVIRLEPPAFPGGSVALSAHVSVARPPTSRRAAESCMGLRTNTAFGSGSRSRPSRRRRDRWSPIAPRG